VLFFRDSGEVLLVNPTYKDYWEVPGGMAEVGESPRAAAVREIREELGLDAEVGRLLALDWNPRGYLPDDGIMLLYLGGPLDDQQIHLDDDELSEWCWCSRAGALKRLVDFKARRVVAGMDAYEQNAIVELEDGLPVRWEALR
jgi:8-oxo-dGTP diphosphatase